MDFSLLARKKSHSTTHTLGQYRLNDTFNSNEDDEHLNDTFNSNEDDEHLVEGQVQGGMEDDDVLVIPTLEEENVLIDVVNGGDKTNEDSINFHFNVSDLY